MSGSPPAQRDAELQGRPVEVEADQLEALELAREARRRQSMSRASWPAFKATATTNGPR
jgi:hypothetical protein